MTAPRHLLDIQAPTMLKDILRVTAGNLLRESRELGQRLLPPERALRATHGAARALTRSWPAAIALAELSATRYAAGAPAADALRVEGPLRVLLASRLGAISAVAELRALALIEALTEAGAELTLCAIRQAPLLEARPELFSRHTIIDATEFSAVDVAAWVSGQDMVLSCCDLSRRRETEADIELAVMALGFARAAGQEAWATGVCAAPGDEDLPRGALAFLRRFGGRVRVSSPLPSCREAWTREGFRVADGPGWGPNEARRGADEAEGGLYVVETAAPEPNLGGMRSAVGEVMQLGAMLLGGPAHGERPVGAEGVNAAQALEGAGPEVRRVRLTRRRPGPRWEVPEGVALEEGGAVVIGSGLELGAFLEDLPPGSVVVSEDPTVLALCEGAGHAGWTAGALVEALGGEAESLASVLRRATRMSERELRPGEWARQVVPRLHTPDGRGLALRGEEVGR